MDPIRRARVETVILEELSQIISFELSDARTKEVSISRVEMAADGRQATIYFGSLGPDALSEEGDILLQDALEGLNNARGFLREKLGPALSLRHIPELFFKIDRGVANTLRVHELLKQIEAEKKTRPPVDDEAPVSTETADPQSAAKTDDKK